MLGLCWDPTGPEQRTREMGDMTWVQKIRMSCWQGGGHGQSFVTQESKIALSSCLDLRVVTAPRNTACFCARMLSDVQALQPSHADKESGSIEHIKCPREQQSYSFVPFQHICHIPGDRSVLLLGLETSALPVGPANGAWSSQRAQVSCAGPSEEPPGLWVMSCVSLLFFIC